MIKISFNDKVKILRKLTNIKIDLRKAPTSSQKSIVSRYYNKLSDLSQDNKIFYRTKNKKALKGNSKFPQFKGIFVENITKNQKVRINKKGIVKISTQLRTYSSYDLAPLWDSFPDSPEDIQTQLDLIVPKSQQMNKKLRWAFRNVVSIRHFSSHDFDQLADLLYSATKNYYENAFSSNLPHAYAELFTMKRKS